MVGQRSLLTGIALLVLAQGLAGCGGSGSPAAPSAAPSAAPAAPAPVAPPTTIHVFTDPVSGFSTSDVRDVHEQIVRFNTAAELIWTADETRFRGYPANGNLNNIGGYPASGNLNKIRGPGPDDYFQVRFGTKNGERRAYLGWDDDWCHCPGSPAAIADIEVVDGRLIITVSDSGVPGT